MASRIIHSAIAKIVASVYEIKDYERFAFGAVLPDAHTDGSAAIDSHLKISICGSSKKTYDLEMFRLRFQEELKTDDLYKGYYLHLIQDLYFRDFVYNKYSWNPLIPGNVQRLHRDYALVNDYIIKTYDIKRGLMIPQGFQKERINKIYPFALSQLMIDYNADFEKAEAGDPFFFTKEMADEFIQKAVIESIKELENLQKGDVYTDMYQMGWRNKVHSLLETTLNTRDLGGYRTASGEYTKQHSLIRSDVMKRASANDVNLLRQMNVTTIIDVRTEKDVSKSPNSFMNLEGFQYRNFPIEDGSKGIKTVEELPRSYVKIAEAENIGRVFQEIALAETGVLFHCTAGKDRTGVISAILLLLAGVSRDDIVADYMITKECNDPRFQLLREKFPELDMNLVIPQERNMVDFLRLFHQKYGTVQEYLYGVGLSQKEISLLKNKLV